jgi:DNA polymerase II small subunit
MLKKRIELHSVISIKRAKSSATKSVSIIGIVSKKNKTKNNFIILEIEDQTDSVNLIINPDNKELYTLAEDLVLDEVIGIKGSIKKDTIFASNIYLPDIPYGKELKKSPEEEYFVILGDLHFGSKYFLKKSFEKFLLWINGLLGNEEQKNIAKKVKYAIITGDVVEGVGVYPSQEKDLSIKNIASQYEELAKFLTKIPNHIKIIILPGNHDACRLQEPQPPISQDFASPLWQIPNVKLVTNPCIVRIGKKPNFEGFDLLLYHGYSLIYYSENVASVWAAGGQKRADLIMKYLLQKRHLAPAHKSVTYIPGAKDPLIIRRVPDFFITGHIHRVSVGSYRNITLINASCWGEITEDQIKRGLDPQPAKIPIVNLKTREVKIMNFYRKESEKN